MFESLKKYLIAVSVALMLATGVLANESVPQNTEPAVESPEYSDEAEIISDSSIKTTYIGDSYYGWSMLNPSGMYLERDKNSNMTAFYDENYNMILVIAGETTEDYDLNSAYKELINMISGDIAFTIAENDEEKQTIHLQAKEENAIVDMRIYGSDGYVYATMAMALTENGADKTILEIVESFALEFRQEDCHDLSEIENGMKKFEEKLMNFTLMLPVNFYNINSSYGKINEFLFYSDKDTIDLEIVSKSEAVLIPEEYVKAMHKRNSDFLNEEFVKTTDVAEKTYGELSCYEFTQYINGTESDDYNVKKYVCFEVGSYQYRLLFRMNGDAETAENTVKTILESSSFNSIDEETVGNIIDMYEPEEYEDFDVVIGRSEITLPGYLDGSNYGGVSYSDEDGRFSFTAQVDVMPQYYTLDMIIDGLMLSPESLPYHKDTASEAIRIDDGENELTAGDITFRVLKIRSISENRPYDKITHLYIGTKDGLLYMISFTTSEVYCNEQTVKLIDDIIGSFRPKVKSKIA